MDTCSIVEFLMLSGKANGYRASADLLFKTAGVELKEGAAGQGLEGLRTPQAPADDGRALYG